MRKICIAILAVLLLNVFMSCSDSTNNINGSWGYASSTYNESSVSNSVEKGDSQDSESINDGMNDVDGNEVGEKIEGALVYASDYSEGFAFVEKYTEKGRLYCVDKEGKIVFKVDGYSALDEHLSMRDIRFTNGFAYIAGDIYDAQGNKTTPSDVGATEFMTVCDSYHGYKIKAVGLPGGYVLAKRITPTKTELGIVSSKMKWLRALSKDFYEEFSAVYNEESADIVGDYLYLGTEEYYLNPFTGEIKNERPMEVEEIADGWAYQRIIYNGENNEYQYGFSADDIKLTVSNLRIYAGGYFCGGKVPFILLNTPTNSPFLALLDKTGKFVFEPFHIMMLPVLLEFDGEYILIGDNQTRITVYNTQGQKVGEWTVSEENGEDVGYVFSLNDGVITLCMYKAGSDYTTTYRHLSVDFLPLYD